MNFYKVLFLSFLVFYVVVCSAQKTAEFGVFGGVSTYMGDLNPDNPINRPSPSAAGFYQLNLNKRYSLKTQLAYGQFSGSGKDLNSQFGILANRSFSNSMVDVSFQFVFHFLPFELNTNVRHNFSPYFASGLACSYVMGGQTPFNITLPFAFGIKKMMGDRFTIGIEWSMRKFFNDDLDGVNSDLKIFKNSLIHNNDWCAFTGIFISCRVFQEKRKCPVYLKN